MPATIEIPDIESRPLVDQRGFPVLFDLFVGGIWIGSRRTIEQCEQWLSHHCGVPVERTGTPW